MIDFLLYKIKTETETIKKNYKKMFHPDVKEFNGLWETYVELYFDLMKVNVFIPIETEYTLYFDYYFTDTGYKNHTQFCKDKFNEFCQKMEVAIKIAEEYLIEREVEI